MAETPYKNEKTEHGPWWLFSLPFIVKDSGYDLIAPATPGDKEINNTPEEVAEAVVAAVSLRHIRQWIEKTTPPDDILQRITRDDLFTSFRPFDGQFTEDARENFALLAGVESWYHIFCDDATNHLTAEAQPELVAIEEFRAPTVEQVESVIMNSSIGLGDQIDGLAELAPGIVAVKFCTRLPAGQKRATVAEIQEKLANDLVELFRKHREEAGVDWVVHRFPDVDQQQSREEVSAFTTLWNSAFKVQLREEKLEKLAANLFKRKLDQRCSYDPVFIVDHRKLGSLRTNFVRMAFSYASEAAWKAVNNLPAPSEWSDHDSLKISEDDFVGVAEAFSDLIASGSVVNVKTFQQTLPASVRTGEGLSNVDSLLSDVEYLLSSKGYVDDPVQRMINAMSTNSRFVFGIDESPPFYTGILDILLRTIVDGQGFLGDIATKSSLSVRECQRIIYRRIHQTKNVFDRLEYLRIKPTPTVTEHHSSICDTNYQAKALRAVATAIRTEGAVNTKRNRRR